MKASLLIAFFGINALAPIAVITPSHASIYCESAVDVARWKINGTGAKTMWIKETSISGHEIPETYKSTNPRELTFTLANDISGNATQYKSAKIVMANPEFRLSVANIVLSACDKYKMIKIWIWGTDRISTYFKMPSGTIEEGSCLPAIAPGRGHLICDPKSVTRTP